ncbi:MAG: type II toxin-antitoxin system RelE/ParE family toxin [Actinomycetota bacterium]|nr:type II toxin-antitoxin system RelE/ParE family toxin [Actinomycetota bacterium]
MSWGSVELEPEVQDWLEGLAGSEFGHAAFYIDLLAERGVLLSEPHTKQLDGKLRELRLDLGRQAIRITYWIAPGRRIILLTVFAKKMDRDRAQVARAKKAMLAWMRAEHHVEEEE